MPKIQLPLKTHGGKYYLAKALIGLFPPHVCYTEPYFGGGAVLLQKDCQDVSEVVNDKNRVLMNFWKCLRVPTFNEFHRLVQCVPFSQGEWRDATAYLREKTLGPGEVNVEAAVAFFVSCRMSLAGRGKNFAPLSKNRLRQRMNEQAAAWMSCVDGLPEVSSRLRRVVLLEEEATATIRRTDGPGTFHYLDPPYLQETRSDKDTYGEYEMSDEDHLVLLAVIKACKGRVMISGYPSETYDRELRGWRTETFDQAKHSSGGDAKARAVEKVWMNYG